MYDDDESGHPLEPAGATQWYWAMQHANSDAARACPSRRMAQWITQSGQKAFLYYWTYVPDASGMCGHGACHCAELPFVWHVLSGASAAGAAAGTAGAARAARAAGAVEAAVAAETWSAFTRGQNPATMVFGPGPVQRRYHFDKSKCNFWDEQFAKLIPHQASSPDGEW